MKAVLILILSLFANQVIALTESEGWAISTTPLGQLEFKSGDKLTASLFDSVYLDGKLILSTSGKTDVWGSKLYLMETEFELVRINGKPKRNPEGKVYINRYLLATGSDGNCLVDFVILDFSGSKPFVSNRFGPNPEGKFCLKFSRAKWGTKKSYISLSGPAKYLYTTGEDVIGPIE
jgi:hypothetical protein